MRSILKDLRFGVRRLVRNPGFTFATLFTLALSTGANSAMFSVVNAALLQPLPYPNAERLVMVWECEASRRAKTRPLSQQSFQELSGQSKSFERVAAFVASGDIGFNLAGEGEPERVRGAVVSADFFPVLGVKASAGRTFAPDDDEPAASPVAVISRRLWRRRFGDDSHIVGRTLRINERSYTVVGVMPDGFDFPDNAEIWVPRPLEAGQAMNSALHVTYGLRVVARLKTGVEPELAQQEADLVARGLQQAYTETHRGIGMRVVPLREELYGTIGPTLLILFGAIGFVLLIACANVASLLLARAAARRHEMAVRAALGASRARLTRQLLTEYLLLAVAGGALGLLCCRWLTSLILALWPAESRPLSGVEIDLRVLGFTLAISLLAGLLFGLLPALEAARTDLSGTLKSSMSRAAFGFRRHGLLSVIVVGEIALAMLLLVGASLLTASFIHLMRTELGFEPRNVLTMKITPSRQKYPDRQRQVAFFEQLLKRVAALPGVRYAGASNFLPLSGSGLHALIKVEGQNPLPGREPSANCVAVTPDYFKAMGILLIKGRLFTEQDAQNAPGVVLIDEAMERRYWPVESPVGKRLNFQGSWREIVGVVRNVQQNKPGVSPSEAQMYVPYAQFDFPWPYMHLVVRSALDEPQGLTAQLREAVWAEDEDQPIENIVTVTQQLSDLLSQRRFAALLFLLFALMALILAVVGIYGVIAFYVSQHTRDIGIRIALGARSADVLRPLVRRGLTLVAAGMLCGLVAALALKRIVASVLYEATAADITPLFFAPLLLLMVTMAAVYIPARKATRVNPLMALRSE